VTNVLRVGCKTKPYEGCFLGHTALSEVTSHTSAGQDPVSRHKFDLTGLMLPTSSYLFRDTMVRRGNRQAGHKTSQAHRSDTRDPLRRTRSMTVCTRTCRRRRLLRVER
jgi:hypothetical protein